MQSQYFRSTISLVSILLFLVISEEALAQSVPPTECDKLAASDTDQQKVGPGVSLSKINSSLAIPACLDDLKRYPDASRLIFQTGRAYHNARNFEKALEFYKRAADLGYQQSVTAVGTIYYNGLGVPKDEELGVIWFRKAADQDNALGQAFVGQAFKSGKGVKQNMIEAVRWFRLSSEQGNVIGQIELAKSYFEGSGVPQNDAEAAKWARRSADQGWAAAQLYLGYLYEKGRGVT